MALALREHRKTVFRRAVLPQPLGGGGANAPARFRKRQALYVQERFRVRNGGPVEGAACCEDLAFSCDFPYSDPAYALLDWHNALEMRRNLSRTTLLVQSIDIIPLQDITDEDCFREGIVEEWRALNEPPVYLIPGSGIEADTPRRAFAAHWNQLQGSGGWNANPWVYRVGVRVYHQNVNVLLHGG
jgi:hypothetical protein